MGVHNQLTVLHARKTEGKADQSGAVEGAHPDAPRLLGCDGQSERRGVEGGESPDFPLDLFDLLQVFKTLQVANCDRRFGFRFSHVEHLRVESEQYTREGGLASARATEPK